MNQKKINILKSNLESKGLKIENWTRFSSYLSIFTFDRFIEDYCFLFVDKKKNTFYENTTDSDLINFILFDKKISVNFLKWFLFFESKFKKTIIEKWMDFYKLNNRNMFSISESELVTYLPNLQKCADLKAQTFRHSLFEHSNNSEFLVKYESLEKIPIQELSYSWSFSTTINFFRTLSDDLKKEILFSFDVPYEFFDIFDKALNSLSKVRNTISHNHIIYTFRSPVFRFEFNKIYKSLFREEINLSSSITLYKVIKFIDYLLGWNLCKKEFENDLKELKINPMAKESLIKIIFDYN